MLKKSNKKLLKPAAAIEKYFDNLLNQTQVETDEYLDLNSKAGVLFLPELDSDMKEQGALYLKETDNSIDSFEFEQERFEPESVLDTVNTEDHQRFKFPMQCLVFYIDRHKLALPLLDLFSVIPKTNNLTRMPQSPDWFAGVVKHRERNINVANLKRLLSMDGGKCDLSYQYVLVLSHNDWGVTCDDLGQVIQIEEDDFKWSSPSNKSFILGTIINSLTALLDVEKIPDLISTGKIKIS